MAKGGHAHDVLSGTARSAVQARIVRGGVHVYDVPPAGHFWVAVCLAVFAILLSVVSLVFVARRAADPVVVGMPTAKPEINRPAGLAEVEIPNALNAAEQAYILEIPERVEVYSYQGYLCAGRIYQRAVIGIPQVPKVSANAALVARDYADKFVTEIWDPEGVIRFESPTRIGLSNYGGSRSYRGMEVAGLLEFAVHDRCGSDVVVLDVFALDQHDSYFVAVVSIGVDAESGYDEASAERDARVILNSMAPGE
jgi:hypothetical protein